MRISLFAASLGAVFAIFQAVQEETPSAKSRESADVSLIAAWVAGEGGGDAFDRPFGDSTFIQKRADALLYTDVAGVKAPKSLKTVPYEFVKARMEMVGGGHKVSPAVLITRTIAEQPREGALRPLADQTNVPADARYYYVEVAIGNMAWHWMRLAVHDVEAKPKVKVLWSGSS